MKKYLLSIIFSLGFLGSGIFTKRYTCDFAEHATDFYGFPFVQSTDSTWVNSMSGIIYIWNFLANMIFWSLIFLVAIWLFQRIKNRISRLTLKVVALVLSVFSLLTSSIFFVAVDWRFEWKHDFKMAYYEHEPECESEFVFFEWM